LRLPQASRSPLGAASQCPAGPDRPAYYTGWNACAQILNGTETPKQAADIVQKDLASWYKPQQGT
jgi:ABC-type glycerol-3-phosphate transport system substrate-binding protein